MFRKRCFSFVGSVSYDCIQKKGKAFDFIIHCCWRPDICVEDYRDSYKRFHHGWQDKHLKSNEGITWCYFWHVLLLAVMGTKAAIIIRQTTVRHDDIWSVLCSKLFMISLKLQSEMYLMLWCTCFFSVASFFVFYFL